MNQSDQVRVCLKMLRLRLGWAPLQMATWLGCSGEELAVWAAAGTCPRHIYNGKIVSLMDSADKNLRRTQVAPMAEKIMEDENLDQMEITAVTFRLES